MIKPPGQGTLKVAELYILLALANRPMFGYGISQQIELDSNGMIKVGWGSMYPSLKRLEKSGFIYKKSTQPSQGSANARQFFDLTKEGREVLALELDRLRQTVNLGRKRLNS